MGKSGKKSKSEKINALRKQYDAFLEEDKKRKDRNEYILGRMETMRSCTALVHVSSKPYPKIEESVYPIPPKYKGTLTHLSNSAIALSGRTHVPKYANTTYDEPSLLREISKKYFLIPKGMSNDVCNLKYNENDRDPIPGDSDWKSKYKILDELKKAEKEDHSNSHLDDLHKNNRNSDISKESHEDSIAQNKTTVSLELTPTKHTDLCEIPNKEVSFKNLDIEPNQNKNDQVDKTWKGENIGVNNLITEKQYLNPQSNKTHEVDLPAHNSLPKKSQLENNITQDTTLICNEKKPEIEESKELRNEKLTSKLEPITTFENNKYLPEEKKCIEINESQDNTTNIMNNLNNNVLPLAHYDNNMELNNENTMGVNNENNELLVKNTENIHEYVDENSVRAQDVYEEVADHLEPSVKNTENTHEVVDENVVRAQGVYEEVADHLKDNTGHQEYQHQESDLNQIQNITSEVNDELENEQKEMFYGEENDKSKEYNENDDTTYQAENENYINQEYSYYDESHKEQAYPTEINEHEESTERYDPNYEQQYANNYDGTMNTTQYQPEQYVDNTYDQPQNMYDQQQGDINYQPENSNYEYEPTDNIKDAEPSQNVYYSNAPQENPQYEAQQLENSDMVEQPNMPYTSEDYEAQQEYITMHAEPLPIENVEQQLDVEDGYLPNTNIVAENIDYQEQLIEETTPEIQQTDIKVT